MAGYQTVTLTQLLARLSQRTETAPFWSTTAATYALHEAIRLFNLFTGIARAEVLVSTVPDTPYINLPDPGQCLKVVRVRRAATLHELNPTSLAGLDASFPGWEAYTTLTAVGVGSAPRYWAPAGTGRIAIYPADTTVVAGGNGPRLLRVDLITCANVPVASSDFLDLGEEEIGVICGYALHVLSFSKGATALAATRPLYLAFLKAAADRNAVFAASSFFRKIIGLDWSRLAYPLRSASSETAAAVLTGETVNGRGQTSRPPGAGTGSAEG